MLLTRLGHRRISLLLPDAHNWSLLTRRPPEVLEKDLAGLALRDKAEVRFKAVPRTLCFDATLDCMAEKARQGRGRQGRESSESDGKAAIGHPKKNLIT